MSEFARIIVTTTSGLRYYGRPATDPALALKNDTSLTLFDVLQVITISAAGGRGMTIRTTKLSNIDFYNFSCPRLDVRISSFYEPVDEAAEEVEMEVAAAKKRAKDALARQEKGEDVPFDEDPAPSLIKPPSLR